MLKVKGPISKINASWALIVVAGISSFAFVKHDINNTRYELLKNKQRAKRALLVLQEPDKLPSENQNVDNLK